MAADINNVTVVGRLTRDAELKYTNSGFAITSMGLAVNRNRKDGDQWVDEANFFDITLLGRRGEVLNQYLLKGTQIAVMGELRQERWEQDGQRRSRVTIVANNIQLLGSKNSGQGSQSQSLGGNSQNNNFNSNNGGNNSYNNSYNNSKPSYENYPSGNAGGNGNFEDDIPF